MKETNRAKNGECDFKRALKIAILISHLVPLFALPLAALAQESAIPRRRISASLVTTGEITVDGSPEDLGWKRIPWNENFVQTEPSEGSQATEQTRFKVATDGAQLYFLVDALDSQPEKLSALLTRRDVSSSSDWIHVLLDTENDRRSAYRFQINPLGVRVDSRIGNDNNEDSSWDAVWNGIAARHINGWVVEISIPLNQLRWTPGSTSWGVQIIRQLQRKVETSVFNPIPRSESYLPKYFAVLELPQLSPSKRLEILPYLRLALHREGDSSASSSKSIRPNAGIDSKAGISSNFTLEVTINPDFGQVEADPSQLNLSATETLLSEKRPFFLENADIFRWRLGFSQDNGETLFYSRRIGRVTQRDPSKFGKILETPGNATIIGAAKLTGKTTDGWTIGFLDAVSKAEFAEVAIEKDLANRQRVLVEPLTQMAALRVLRDFNGGKSQIGMLASDTIRHLAFSSSSYFPSQAIAGGLDFNHRFDAFASSWELKAEAFGSSLFGKSEAMDRIQRSDTHFMQRPDASTGYNSQKTSLSGWGSLLGMRKISGDKLRLGAEFWARSPGLDLNDMGFLPSTDVQGAFIWCQLRDESQTPLRKLAYITLNFAGSRTFEGELTGLKSFLNANWVFPDTSYIYAGVQYDAAALEARALRGGPALAVPQSVNIWGGLGIDDRKPWSIGLDATTTAIGDNAGWGFSVTPWGIARPSSSLEISLKPSYQRTRLGHQWVSNLEEINEPTRYFVGNLLRETWSLTLRVSISLTPELSIQWYAMPYFSAGTYDEFLEVKFPRARDYSDRFEPVSKAFASAQLDKSDRFLYSQVRSNLVLRWEFRPGSSLYLAWSHEQTDDNNRAGALAWRHVGDLFEQAASDVVLAKLIWWL